jgi:GGDEF domain-containing protein
VLLHAQDLTSSEGSGPQLSPQALSRVVNSVRRALRGADVLSRLTDNELAVLLAQTDPKAAQFVVSRISTQLKEGGDRAEGLGFFMGVATAPMDGTSLHSLVQAARGRLRSTSNVQGDSSSSVH